MTFESANTRIDAALNTDSPANSLADLAKAFKAEGMSQHDMHQLFDQHRAKHAGDADETKYDAILDTMDYIVGFCQPGARLF